MKESKIYNKNGWRSRYRRGEVVVEYRKEPVMLGIGIHVSAHGKEGYPFPSKPEHIESWNYWITRPDKHSFNCYGEYKTAEKAMSAAEKAGKKFLLRAAAMLTKASDKL